jgi:hypothetical protein
VYRQIGEEPLGGLLRKVRQIAKTKVKGFDGECWRGAAENSPVSENSKLVQTNWREELLGMLRGKSKAREKNFTGVP